MGETPEGIGGGQVVPGRQVRMVVGRRVVLLFSLVASALAILAWYGLLWAIGGDPWLTSGDVEFADWLPVLGTTLAAAALWSLYVFMWRRSG